MDYRKSAEEFVRLMCMVKKPPHDAKLEKISKGGYFILGILAKNNGNMKPSDLAKKANISSARVAAVINLQEEKGNVRREPIPGDRRQTNVVLTEKGYKITEQIHEESLVELTEYLKSLGEEDTENFLRIMKKTGDYFNNKANELGKDA